VIAGVVLATLAMVLNLVILYLVVTDTFGSSSPNSISNGTLTLEGWRVKSDDNRLIFEATDNSGETWFPTAYFDKDSGLVVLDVV
jgi:hypothetical protein